MIVLSPHFTLDEAIKSQVASRHGIDNMPPAEAIAAMRKVAENILEPIRARYGRPITPSSWYRCLKLNRILGSRDTSQHVLGEAVDFEVPGVDNLEVAQWIVGNLSFDQLILEFYDGVDPNSGWIHCSYRYPCRGEVLRFDGKTYQSGLGVTTKE